MAKIEVEINDDGFMPVIPEPLKAYMEERIGEAYRKGAEKAEKRSAPYVLEPTELERLRQRDKALADIELKEAERAKEYEKVLKMRDEAHAKAIDEAIKAERRNTTAALEKVREGAKKSIRAAALTHGARAESLEELERLLAADVDLDPDLNEFVVDATDRKKPRMVKDGDKDVPVTIEGFVADYLKTHPHHVAAPASVSGKARGGATLAGQPPKAPGGDTRQALRDAVAENPSVQNVSKLLRAATSAA